MIYSNPLPPFFHLFQNASVTVSIHVQDGMHHHEGALQRRTELILSLRQQSSRASYCAGGLCKTERDTSRAEQGTSLSGLHLYYMIHMIRMGRA